MTQTQQGTQGAIGPATGGGIGHDDDDDDDEDEDDEDDDDGDDDDEEEGILLKYLAKASCIHSKPYIVRGVCL